MKIVLETIPIGETHRCNYPTCGDWHWEGTQLFVTVSDIGDMRSNAAVMVHEMVEAILCSMRDISEETVSDFDRQFEKEGHKDFEEPGDDPRAPYRMEHQAANLAEMIVLSLLGGDWKQHCSDVAKAAQ